MLRMRVWRAFLAQMCLKLEFGGLPLTLSAPQTDLEGEGGVLAAPLPFKLPLPPLRGASRATGVMEHAGRPCGNLASSLALGRRSGSRPPPSEMASHVSSDGPKRLIVRGPQEGV